MNIYKGSRCDEWGTPPELLEQIIHPNWNMFDVCASDENHKFPDYWKKSDNCLRRPWPIDRTCWMNPPFSSAKSFFEKAAKEAARGVKIVAIYKACNLDTKTWQEAILPHASAVLFLKGRTNYVMDGGRSKNVPFGSAIIYYNMVPVKLPKELGCLWFLRL